MCLPRRVSRYQKTISFSAFKQFVGINKIVPVYQMTNLCGYLTEPRYQKHK
jgi:hypothetical protein